MHCNLMVTKIKLLVFINFLFDIFSLETIIQNVKPTVVLLSINTLPKSKLVIIRYFYL